MALSNVRVGLAADRPAADPSNRGLVWVSSDTNEIAGSDGVEWVDAGVTIAPGENVAVGTQQADIVDATPHPGLTSSASDEALAPALTSAQIAGGESPTEGEYNQLQADVDALRTAFNEVATDHSLVQDDVSTVRQTLNDLIASFNDVLDVLDEYGMTA